MGNNKQDTLLNGQDYSLFLAKRRETEKNHAKSYTVTRTDKIVLGCPPQKPQSPAAIQFVSRNCHLPGAIAALI